MSVYNAGFHVGTGMPIPRNPGALKPSAQGSYLRAARRGKITPVQLDQLTQMVVKRRKAGQW